MKSTYNIIASEDKNNKLIKRITVNAWDLNTPFRGRKNFETFDRSSDFKVTI